jgi:hypothetical protein
MSDTATISESKPSLKNQLEAMIDQHGLGEIIHALASACDQSGNNWRDLKLDTTAELWWKAADKVRSILKSESVKAVSGRTE